MKVPAYWKKALIVPIFKKGARTCPANYRPMSLTYIPYKIFEHVIYSHIFKHLNTHSILSPEQHEFESITCKSQLITTIDDLLYILTQVLRLTPYCLTFPKPLIKFHTNIYLQNLHTKVFKGHH